MTPPLKCIYEINVDRDLIVFVVELELTSEKQKTREERM